MKTRRTSFDVEVKESPIDGHGVFATRHFDKGDVIGIISGYVPEEIDLACDYTCVFEDNEGNLYAVEPTAPFKYLNHSSHPNVDWDTPIIIAQRDIEAGEELTIHYGDEWADAFAKEDADESD